jgi:hypothetical protein
MMRKSLAGKWKSWTKRTPRVPEGGPVAATSRWTGPDESLRPAARILSKRGVGVLYERARTGTARSVAPRPAK